MMRILVTGGAGYIGSALCVELARRHDVVCWDPGFFGYWLGDDTEGIRLERRRVQALTAADLEEMRPDWVLHLSGLSNDPMADFAPHLNRLENTDATCHVGELTNRCGIPLVFASSASVYGFNEGGPLEEDAPVQPIGHYSESKAAAERWLLRHHHHPIVLRQATVMGVSPRMRLDLLTNGMTTSAWMRGRLRVLYGGRETRAQVHVKDLVDAYARVIETPELPSGVYNVAASNDAVMELALTIRDQLADRRQGGVELEVTDEARIHRSYALRADKLRDRTGWEPKMDVAATVEEVRQWLEQPGVDPADPRHYNIRWMKLLHEADSILGRVGSLDSEPSSAPPERRVPR